jgi:hypothetical protein
MTRTVCPDCGHATHVTADNRLGNHPGRYSPRCDSTDNPVTTPTFEGARRPTPSEEAAERYRKREAKRLAYEAQVAEEKRRWAELVKNVDTRHFRSDDGYHPVPRIRVVSGGLPGHGRRR